MCKADFCWGGDWIFGVVGGGGVGSVRVHDCFTKNTRVYLYDSAS